jgi:hypothetical protein
MKAHRSNKAMRARHRWNASEVMIENDDARLVDTPSFDFKIICAWIYLQGA